MELVKNTESVKIKGKSVSYEAEYYRCLTCGTELEEPEQMDRNLDNAREVYDRLYQTPSPEELVALRAQYKASQKAFGTLLGFSESTMNTYEKGASTPDPSNRLLL